MKTTQTIEAALLLLCAFSAMDQTRGEGIPEPPIILYGTVKNDAFGNRDILWTIGTLTWRYQNSTGRVVTISVPLTNINNQFSYAVEIPCEAGLSGFPAGSNSVLLLSAGAQMNTRSASIDGTNAMIVGPASSTVFMTPTNRAHIERVDLKVSLPLSDDDQDGIADYWEQFYFGSTGSDPGADPDKDGISNLEEFRAGTDPNVSNLRFVQVQALGDNRVRVDWSSATGKVYVVERSSSLPSGFAPIKTGVTSTPPVNIFLDTNAAGAGPYFYRIRNDP